VSNKKGEKTISKKKESGGHEWSIQIKVEICTNLCQINTNQAAGVVIVKVIITLTQSIEKQSYSTTLCRDHL
jgi:hypothetical protein